MGEVIRFPTEEALKRDLVRLRATLAVERFKTRVRSLLRRLDAAERAVASAPPGARATAFLQHRDPGDEDGQ